jgi:acetolactate synthase small subunit
MHLNANGKDKTVELIRQTVSTLKRKQVKSRIVLKWLENQTTLIQNELKEKTSNQSATIKKMVAAKVANSTTASTTVVKGDSSKLTSPVSATATTEEAEISRTTTKCRWKEVTIEQNTTTNVSRANR